MKNPKSSNTRTISEAEARALCALRDLLHARMERELIATADILLQKIARANVRAFSVVTTVILMRMFDYFAVNASEEERRGVEIVKGILPKGLVSDFICTFLHEKDPAKLKLAALGYFQELLETNPPAAAALERAALEPLRNEAEARGMEAVVRVIDELGNLNPEKESPAPVTERVQ